MTGRRKGVRLEHYDYSQDGAYFVTVCTHNSVNLFGNINLECRGTACCALNKCGMVVERCWLDIPNHFAHVVLDEYIIMPNHMHGIVVIQAPDTACRVPTYEKYGKPVHGSLSTVIRSFKSAVTKQIHELSTDADNIWQRSFHERIIRHENELNRIRNYIVTNPLNWQTDEYYDVR